MVSSRFVKMLRPMIMMKNQYRFKSTYNRGVDFLFKKNLLLTNSITSGLFMAIGDLIQQEIEINSNTFQKRYDWMRTGRMFIVGTVMGPVHHYYYIYLDKLLPKIDLKTVAKKIMSDQLLASPATILCFFFGMGLLEKKSIPECTEEIKQKFKLVYMVDCLFWPPVQFVNFYYLPTHYRVFYINVATMIFDVFLSFSKHYDQI